MTNYKMNFGIIAIYVGMMIFINLAFGLVILFLPDMVNTDAAIDQLNFYSSLVFYIGLFLIFIIVFRRYFAAQINYCIQNKKQILKVIGIGLSLMLIASFIASVLLSLLGVTETSQNQDSLNQISNGSLFEKIGLFVFSVLMAPIVEEFVYRKAVFGILERVNFVVAIIFSALLFGFMHVTGGDYIQIIYYAGLGIVLGIVYHLSKNNIIVPITVHLCFNLFVNVMMFIG